MELQAPSRWRTADFISDLHMQASEPATFGAWRDYMLATPAEAVFLLGDVFEVWVGDDAAAEGSFEAQCGEVMREASRTRAVFFMHGNRDFLVGESFLRPAGVTLLQDPCVLAFGGKRWLLTHGDALCLDDSGYMAFRAEVRSPEWQRTFLARPLAERQAVARGLRERSEALKKEVAAYADVDAPAARELMSAAGAGTMIHGHTHRPADHDLGSGLLRHVLSDWDLAASPQRAEVLRLHSDGTAARLSWREAENGSTSATDGPAQRPPAPG
ncbi:MAG: UDP-2,3-diacylglucosamine diphosphatase [Burkholderiaceae bacterium]